MKTSKSGLYNIERSGELGFNIRDDIARRYKPDSIFEMPAAPYILMGICALVDAFFFYTLFSSISFESPFQLIVEIIGCLIGLDVVPVYLGNQYKRMKQGYRINKAMFGLALSAIALTCIVNIVLRISVAQMTMLEASSPEKYLGAVAAVQTSQKTVISPDVIATTVFGIVIPFITSIASFFVSYSTYSPLKVQMRREEELIEENREYLRRLDAFITEYGLDTDFGERIQADDDRKYQEMQNHHRALALSYCEYVREKLEEHLGDSSSMSLLAGESFTDLLARLDKEIQALREPFGTKDINLPEAKQTAISINEVA